MCERIEDLVQGVRAFVGALDGGELPAERAAQLFEMFSVLNKLAAGGRTIAAAHVQRTRAWFGSGESSLVAWMARRTGSTMRHAGDVLETAARLEDLPVTKAALVSGKLSDKQAVEISAAAAADPGAEGPLLALAAQSSFGELREKCRDVIATAAGDEAVNERIRRTRFLKHWTDRDGALRLDARLAPDDGAPLLAAIQTRADELRKDAGALRESHDAHAADALCSLVDGKGAPKSVVYVHVSQEALDRGRTQAGETCRIQGVAPISVSAARRMALNGSVTLLETDGVDVTRVSSIGRLIPASTRRALSARDPVCVVPECNKRRDLEIDHILPLSSGGKTELANLCRLCRWHHAQKTHHGFMLEGAPGRWRWSRRRAGAP